MNILGLDVGDKRVGLALANTIARLPNPLDIISPQELIENLPRIIQDNNLESIVIGLPKNADGTESKQAQKIRDFAQNIKQKSALPVYLSDESLSSEYARKFVADNKAYKSRKYYDDIAACYILEEYFGGNFEEIV